MNRGLILEAVEALRQRKCRPDREAIAHQVLKKYTAQFQDIFNDLETIVDQGDLIKVEYKGSVSYRSPDALDTKASPLLTKHSKILNSLRITRFILTAVTELLAENDTYTKQGIPHKAIHAKLVEFDSTRFTIVNIPIFLQREVTVGTLLTTSQGHLLPKDLFIKKISYGGDTASDTSEVLTMRSKKGIAVATKPPATDVAEPLETQETNEVFAVKSLPVSVPDSLAKPVRSYGRKSAGSAEKPEDKESAGSPKKPTVKMEVDEEKNGSDKTPTVNATTPVEEPSTGRSVRNKRKKEVFDPSDLPKKRPSVPPTPTVKVEKEKTPKVKLAPTPIPKPKRQYRKRSKESPAGKDTITVRLCTQCQRQRNARGQNESLLVCGGCSGTYHPSCLEYDKKQASRLIQTGTWQCSKCKLCQLCHIKPGKGPETMLCASCDMGFHLKCLKLDKLAPNKAWLCPGCQGETKPGFQDAEEIKPEMKPEIGDAEEIKTETKPEVGDASHKSEEAEATVVVTTEAKATVKDESLTAVKARVPTGKKRIISLTLDKKRDVENTVEEKGVATAAGGEGTGGTDAGNDDLDIPTDASKWTPLNVEAYFKKHGLRDEGILFREQEIDGLSLLLMRRQDIVNGMKLLLGPALKVFKIVASLQQSGGKVDLR